ncbi:uncharacterized protein LOC122252380 [Penaeus japonicus]|uniref:uncharacterized protein LOC122252380 n=1 Tax=Penaeus japonicus TaxID=27405 RepID=UPI001C7114ED|nr:uncharacterized protein LOC122252380 [Penaeus japonicus]XP_042870764.1 uncharacterized protein LOC122252380 [Penaeus japonicus]
MDEVFGNSSSETVMEADLSRVLANINQDIADLQYLQLQQEPPKPAARAAHTQPPAATTTNMAHIVNRPMPRSYAGVPAPCSARVPQEKGVGAVAHVPVITSVSRHRSEHEATGGSMALRHTQSAVVGRVCQSQCPRPRALSTGAAAHHVHHQNHQNHQNHHCQQQSHPKSSTPFPLGPQSAHEATHCYVNLQPLQRQDRPVSVYDNVVGPPPTTGTPPHSAPPILSTASASPLPTPKPLYMNVPLPAASRMSPQKENLNNSGLCGSNSAPSTPRGGTGAPHRLHHSYIEIWTGTKEERDSLSDSECEELKRSFQEPQTPSSHRPSPGYVEMSSPYIKSPQVPSPFNGSVLADLANKLATYAGHQPRNIFCPFCPRYFGYEKSLGSHIHKVHREELNTMVESRPGQVQLQFCPICQARFFNNSVLPKHLIDFHRASVIEILEKNNCIMSDTAGIQCPFCTKKVPHGKTGEQVLLYHMQQLHLSDFESMVNSKFKPLTSGASAESLRSLSSGDLSQLVSFHPGVTSTPGLSNKMGTMTLATGASGRNMEALDLDATWSSHRGKFRSPMPPPPPRPQATATKEQAQQPPAQTNIQEGQKHLPVSTSKGILRHQSGLSRKPSVKRELRFSVPPVTSEEVFIPESPEQSTPERQMQEQQRQNYQNHHQLQQMQGQEVCEDGSRRTIPIRVDSLSAADFMDLNEKAGGQRKRRRLGLGLRSRKAFKKRDKENIGERELSSFVSGASKIVDGAKKLITDGSQTGPGEVVPTAATRTFRRPRPVAMPRVPDLPPPPGTHVCQGNTEMMQQEENHTAVLDKDEDNGSDVSPFTNLKLYSPLRMFRCNTCRVKFCDNESLSGHIGSRHRGLLYLLRPQYGCGVCSARFYENKYLVKHCLQHHTSLLEIRSPRKHKIAIYRFTHA